MSIRFQIVALMGAVLLAALALYLVLATRLLTRDKLAYIYDLESSLGAALSEDVRGNVGALADKLSYFAAERAEGGPAAARALLSGDRDLLAAEVWERRGGRFVRVARHVERERLAEANLTEEDLAASSRDTPVPFDAVAAGEVVLQNASLPPDGAILSLAVAGGGAGRVVVAAVKPDRLLRVFARTTAFRAYLIDGAGRVVVHPDPARVISRADLASRPIVADAIRGKIARGAREVGGPDGPMIAAFAQVGVGRLAVIVEVPREEALRAARQLLTRSVLFGVAALLLALAAGVYFANRLTAPLRRLEAATRALGRGDFGVEVGKATSGEIGRLAAAFERMRRDIAERDARISEAHLELALTGKLAIIGEFAASVAHEVKNPLSAIVGYAQFGRSAPDLDEAKQLFGLVEDHAWRGSKILTTLLGFTRDPKPTIGPIDASAVIEDVLRLLSPQMRMKRIQIETAFDPSGPRIAGSPSELQQVLVNLILNAADAMEGCRDKRLTLGTARDGSFGVLSVRDTGRGLTPEAQARLFTPFFTTKPSGQGTGLGLSVSQRIVKQHGGDIHAETEPGIGTVFVVRIPLAEQAEPAATSETAAG
ncbi:MAG TPA: ATP-binding protein [Anaeromyxobacter sp.]|nr:ATP-binding protein [Anaeromyxobacter sp.]